MKYDALFFSPHLDDAILSSWHALYRLKSDRKSVLMVSCFTKATDSPITNDGLDFVTKCGCGKPSALFALRRKEDRDATSLLGVDVLHLPFIDGLYRWYLRSPSDLVFRFRPLSVSYPGYRSLFSGTVSTLDQKFLLPKLVTRFSRIVNQHATEQTKIFGPLGVGAHADHLLVFMALRSLPKLPSRRVVFWEDIPYNTHGPAIAKRLSIIKRPYRAQTVKLSNGLFQKKIESAMRYTSQIQLLFPNNNFQSLRTERYYHLV